MIHRTHFIIVAALLLAQALASAVMVAGVPDPAPIHWDVHGNADGFGPRWMLLTLTPAVTALAAALLITLPLLGPMRRNIERFRNVYGKFVIAFVAAIGAVHALTLAKAAGAAVRIEIVVPLVLGLLLAVMGNWMGKVRRNFWIGVRTPWTLASDAVWDRTNRAGGRLLVAHGLLVAVIALFGRPWLTFGTLMAGAVALAIWSIGYSLWLYRRLGQPDQLS